MMLKGLVLVLGLAVSCYGFTVPLSQVKVTDHGLHGIIPHKRAVVADNKKSARIQGHTVHRRSHGSELSFESDSSDSDSEGDLDNSASGYEGFRHNHFGGFHSFLPYPPHNHGGPFPGPYPPSFGQQHHQFPGHDHNNGWGNKFGHGNDHGFGYGHGNDHGFGHGHGNDNGFGHGHDNGHGFGHGHGNDHGHGNGHGHGHGNGYGHDNEKQNENPCFETGPGNGHGQGHGNAGGHQHGQGHFQHGNGHGYGHDHHGHGNGPEFGHIDCDDNSSENNGPEHTTESHHTEPSPIHEMPTTPTVKVPPVIPTHPSVPPTEKIPVPTEPTTTPYPNYDIDVRLGSKK